MTDRPDFDAYAESYDEDLRRALWISGEDKGYFAQARVAWLSTCLADHKVKPGSVMDFGCGTGSTVPILAKTFESSSVIGIDVSPKLIELAAKATSDVRLSFRLMDNYEPTGQIDLAFSSGVFHHIPPDHRQKALNFVYRSLRPGGWFSLWENNPWNPGTRYVMRHCVFDRGAITITPPEAQRLIRTGGFRHVRTDFHFIFPRALGWFRPMERYVSHFPFGSQYQVLMRKPT